MKKIIMLKWLPASGKSTRAKHAVLEWKWKYKRINKDELRGMVDMWVWSKSNEAEIIQARDFLISLYIHRWYCVIIDDTNLAPKHEESIKQQAAKLWAVFEVVELDTPVDVYLDRNKRRENPVDDSVILNMYNRYIKPPYSPISTAWNIVICDIDGTLAHMKDRSPYERSRVGEDCVDEHVKEMLEMFMDSLWKDIYLCSWRDAVCRKQTDRRLKENWIIYAKLMMRGEGSNEKDAVVKKKMLDEIGKENVYCVIDDRPQVIKMWKEEGLFVLNVGDWIDF